MRHKQLLSKRIKSRTCHFKNDNLPIKGTQLGPRDPFLKFGAYVPYLIRVEIRISNLV